MNTVLDPETQKEVQKFSKDSSHWWDPEGPFKPLHRLNPERLSYIKQQICDHYDLDFKSLKPFEKLNILDIGCGGGLVCEPLARLGAKVTGADADANAIQVAKSHATESGLKITYENKPAEDLKKTYDVVLALEIIEHVKDPSSFVENVSKLVKPGGLVIFSTLNRNPKSFLLGIVAAEYILRWVPQGTHQWKKFLKPSELSRLCRKHKLKTHDICGLMFDPFENAFKLSKTDIDVNYFMTAKK